IFDSFNAYQKTAVLKGAIELDLFTALGEGADTAPALARKLSVSERGARILCDYLVVAGLLTKTGNRYALTQDTAMFLDRRSPACLSSSIKFLNSPMMISYFSDVAGTVRNGGSIVSAQGTMTPEDPVWVDFARAMAPVLAMPAEAIAGILE